MRISSKIHICVVFVVSYTGSGIKAAGRLMVSIGDNIIRFCDDLVDRRGDPEAYRVRRAARKYEEALARLKAAEAAKVAAEEAIAKQA